ncbi:MAG: EAL domain-containing protein [Actinomycetota bacterium]|nr:EAL domain-containing protein [Actinomycetota bacterium]
MIDKALRQLRTWREQGRPLTVAVNISARNLLDPELPDDVAGLLAAHGLEPGRLELEISESTVMGIPAAPWTCCRGCPGWGSAWPSTTTASATRRWPTCAGCRSTP